MSKQVKKHLDTSMLSTQDEDEVDYVLFGLETESNNFKAVQNDLPADFRKALSGHSDDHPFHKLNKQQRNELDPDSSFIAFDDYKTPMSSKDEPVFPIRDWDRKLKYAPYPEKNKMMRIAISRLQGIVDINNDPKWKYLGESRSNKIWSMEDETLGIRSTKGECWIDYSPYECFYMITDISDEAKINDPLFDVTRIIEKYGQNTYKIHQRTCRIGPIYPRDFVYMVHGNELEDGTVLVTCFSVEDPDIPPQKGVVRAQLYQTGWILKPDPHNPRRTLGTFIGQVDLKGYIPKFAYALACKKVALTPRILEDTMKELEIKWGSLYLPEHIRKR